ncbi:MAG: hypothetical protein ABR501_01085 [Pyrinomonadaceae bacterium]
MPEQQLPGTDSSLDEPHFDEEATVLARPVVPLEKVAASPRVRKGLASSHGKRGWIFVLTVAGALLAGMAATTFYYSRSNNKARSANEAATITSGSSGTEAQLTEVKPEPRGSAAENVAPQTRTRSRRELATTIPPTDGIESPQAARDFPIRPVARRVATITLGREQQDDDERREERRAARREAKERRRERRYNEDNKAANELVRIREIFEGPRKH